MRARASASRGTVSFEVASPLPMSSARACLMRSFIPRVSLVAGGRGAARPPAAGGGRIGVRWRLFVAMTPRTHQRKAWELARRQHGVITRGHLLDLGFTDDAIRHRISRGRLRRLYPGVYAVAQLELTSAGEWMAAVLASGKTAALSHDSAAVLWELTKAPPRRIDVSVLSQSRSRKGIVVHRRTALRSTTHKGIRVTTPAQTLIDVAQTWTGACSNRRLGIPTSVGLSA